MPALGQTKERRMGKDMTEGELGEQCERRAVERKWQRWWWTRSSVEQNKQVKVSKIFNDLYFIYIP